MPRGKNKQKKVSQLNANGFHIKLGSQIQLTLPTFHPIPLKTTLTHSLFNPHPHSTPIMPNMLPTSYPQADSHQ